MLYSCRQAIKGGSPIDKLYIYLLREPFCNECCHMNWFRDLREEESRKAKLGPQFHVVKGIAPAENLVIGHECFNEPALFLVFEGPVCS
jgi:hypothetical protein